MILTEVFVGSYLFCIYLQCFWRKFSAHLGLGVGGGGTTKNTYRTRYGGRSDNILSGHLQQYNRPPEAAYVAHRTMTRFYFFSQGLTSRPQ